MEVSEIAIKCATYVRNPYERAARVAHIGAARFLQQLVTTTGAVDAMVRDLIRSGHLPVAEVVVLAVGHYQARGSLNTNSILSPEVVPASTLRRLRMNREELLPVLAAAGRVHEALKQIAGTSDAVVTVRAEAWQACFGASLEHARQLRRLIRQHNVLVLGDSGTGKELVARAIQAGTPGPGDGVPPAVAINAAAIPEHLVESELFGHEAGAFTDAKSKRRGTVRSAHEGTLFIDEVADLPAKAQSALLRTVQEGHVRPLGSDEAPVAVDVRYVGATHRPIERLMAQGAFREDLYHRLSGTVIRVPPLRDRPEDIPEIGLAYVDRVAPGFELGPLREMLYSEEAARYSWPGNVRELHTAIRRTMLGDRWLPPGDFSTPARPGDDLPQGVLSGEWSEAKLIAWYTRRVLTKLDGNQSKTAQRLDIDRTTVARRLRNASDATD